MKRKDGPKGVLDDSDLEELKGEVGLEKALEVELGGVRRVKKRVYGGGLENIASEVRALRSELREELAEIKALVRKLDER